MERSTRCFGQVAETQTAVTLQLCSRRCMNGRLTTLADGREDRSENSKLSALWGPRSAEPRKVVPVEFWPIAPLRLTGAV